MRVGSAGSVRVVSGELAVGMVRVVSGETGITHKVLYWI